MKPDIKKGFKEQGDQAGWEFSIHSMLRYYDCNYAIYKQQPQYNTMCYKERRMAHM